MITRDTNHMQIQPGMEDIGSEIMDKVIDLMNSYDCDSYTEKDVFAALNSEKITPDQFGALLSPAALPFLEQAAIKAKKETKKHFGSSVYMFTPLYISNYCESHCVYCGFNCKNKIHRARLERHEIEKELQSIAQTGLEEILLLTGESKVKSNLDYICMAVTLAKKHFKNVGVEIYPLNSDEYARLHKCGADFVTVFQETYNSEKYEALHLGGAKRIFPYRFNAQERAIRGGMRGVAFGALLGLDNFRKDAYAAGLHAYYLQRKYPHAEISFSCPRLRPTVNNNKINPKDVHERQLLQVMLAYRLFMPFSGITISTRERAGFRDSVIGLCATKISAGVSVGVGGHGENVKGDAQFEISDGRSVEEIYNAILKKGLQPVMNDYIYV